MQIEVVDDCSTEGDALGQAAEALRTSPRPATAASLARTFLAAGSRRARAALRRRVTAL